MKFEYKVVLEASGFLTSFFPFLAELNKLGGEGWELVAVTVAGANNTHAAFLKRPLPE